MLLQFLHFTLRVVATDITTFRQNYNIGGKQIKGGKQMKRKLDTNKVGMFIATVITTALLIQKIVQAGTIFCLSTIY